MQCAFNGAQISTSWGNILRDLHTLCRYLVKLIIHQIDDAQLVKTSWLKSFQTVVIQNNFLQGWQTTQFSRQGTLQII